MAFELDVPPPAATIGAVQIAASAVVELTFIGVGLAGAYSQGVVAGLDEEHPELASRLQEFWGDGLPWLGDLMVVADRTDTLAGDDPEPFFAALADGVPSGSLHLESETADERRAIAARLAALADDEALRRRYVLLLREVWDTCKAVLLDSRAALEQTVEAWSGRLAAGEHLLDLLNDKHIARWPQFAGLVRSAERGGTVLLTPGATFTGGSIVALEHALAIAAPLVRQSPVELRRAAATEIAGRLKVLNDPTRVALLSHLACHPASVTELAATFSLAQPTVSIHVRQLREAGLAESRRDGGRTIYSVPRDRVERLLAETGDLLLRFCDPE